MEETSAQSIGGTETITSKGSWSDGAAQINSNPVIVTSVESSKLFTVSSSQTRGVISVRTVPISSYNCLVTETKIV